MNLLLDTHVWFWALESPNELGPRCRAELESANNALSVATISVVEFGQLQTVGRLAFKGTLESWLRRGMQDLDLRALDLTPPIALLAYALPGVFHKDPADRILVATAVHHGYRMVTADERILAYPHVLSLDARF